jgi:hypothetical protein
MKLLRISGLLLFLLSAISFAGYYGYETSRNDNVGPVIEFTGDEIVVGVEATNEELLNNVTAYDEKDGNVTDTVLVEAVSDFIGPGQRMITYAAFDSNGNVTKKERKLVYTDYKPPRFSLEKPLRFAVGDAANILRYLKVWDCIDGDLTENIKYEEPNAYFGTAEDTYQMKFQVTNSAGDTAVLPAEIEFYTPVYNSEKLIPEILLDEYLIYLKAGDTFKPEAHLKGVRINQEEYRIAEDGGAQGEPSSNATISKKSISISTNVNTRKPGIYQAEYSMTAQNGYRGATKLLIVVEE